MRCSAGRDPLKNDSDRLRQTEEFAEKSAEETTRKAVEKTAEVSTENECFPLPKIVDFASFFFAYLCLLPSPRQ